MTLADSLYEDSRAVRLRLHRTEVRDQHGQISYQRIRGKQHEGEMPLQRTARPAGDGRGWSSMPVLLACVLVGLLVVIWPFRRALVNASIRTGVRSLLQAGCSVCW
jgi:hypothetical protein